MQLATAGHGGTRQGSQGYPCSQERLSVRAVTASGASAISTVDDAVAAQSGRDMAMGNSAAQ